MNQVQIRQVPITPSLSPERTAGAWFPTGYYGHFRAKPRIDLSNSFRQLARPNPPKIFIERQTSAATTHQFSDHDNRHRYEADPLIRGAQKGIGRRRTKSRAAGEFDPFLVSWLPKNADRKTYVDEIKVSSYADDYSHDSLPPPISFDPSLLNPTLSKSLPDIQPVKPSTAKEFSIYQIGFSHGQPDATHSKKIREETFQRYAGTAIRRAQIRHIDRSTDVATCLAWSSVDCDPPTITTTAKKTEKSINADAPVAKQTRITSSIETSQNQINPYHSESMPAFKNIERATFDITPLPEYVTVKVPPALRRATSFVQPRHSSMDSLIAKYM